MLECGHSGEIFRGFSFFYKYINFKKYISFVAPILSLGTTLGFIETLTKVYTTIMDVAEWLIHSILIMEIFQGTDCGADELARIGKTLHISYMIRNFVKFYFILT